MSSTPVTVKVGKLYSLTGEKLNPGGKPVWDCGSLADPKTLVTRVQWDTDIFVILSCKDGETDDCFWTEILTPDGLIGWIYCCTKNQRLVLEEEHRDC